MAKLPQCDRCLYCAHDYHLVCAAHPNGPEANVCPDFIADPALEGKHFVDFLGLQQQTEENNKLSHIEAFNAEYSDQQWQPEGVFFVNGELVINEERSFYNGQEIVQPEQHWTQEEMLQLIDEHPIFTGRCPSCEMPFPRFEKPPVH